MLSSLQNVFRIPELRKRILMTLALLFVYRIGSHIPIPGVDTDAVRQSLDAAQQGALGGLFGVFNTLSGGSIGSLVLFSLGIMPYISASIIFSLLTKVVPTLEKLAKEGPQGQKKINQYTRYATIPLCIIQGFFIVRGVIPQLLDQGGPPVIDRAVYNTFSYQAMAILAFTTGGIFLMWLGEQITEHGIGNGISLLIMCGIIAEMPVALRTFISFPGLETTSKIQTGILLSLLYLGVVLIVVLITKAHRRIPVQYARQTRGRRVYGGQRHYLPIKVNQAGVMPVIFASSLLIIPSALLNLGGGTLARAFSSTSFWYLSIYIGLIFFFSFFWTTLMIQPTEMANNMKEYGSFIPGIRPGRRTAEYLEAIMVRLTLAGAAFLAFIALLPQVASRALDVQSIFTRFLGGTSILIVVGVALDMVDKMNSFLLMRDYEGFMRRRGGGRR
jgi:preprotein translocase subunit SecY